MALRLDSHLLCLRIAESGRVDVHPNHILPFPSQEHLGNNPLEEGPVEVEHIAQGPEGDHVLENLLAVLFPGQGTQEKAVERFSLGFLRGKIGDSLAVAEDEHGIANMDSVAMLQRSGPTDRPAVDYRAVAAVQIDDNEALGRLGDLGMMA